MEHLKELVSTKPRRLGLFVALYVLFSMVGAYNLGLLAALIYIIWLLDKE